MKDYYQILGVRRGAGLPEIRRAYRILVQKLHPDINPDPAAHELIKEVNEAYDVLGDVEKKSGYDYQLLNPYGAGGAPQQPVHRDPYFSRKGRSAPAYNVEKSARIQLMEKSLSFFHWIFRVAAVFCFVLLVDYLIPRSVTTENVVGFYELRAAGRYGGTHRTGNSLVATNSGRSFTIETKDTKFFRADPVIMVYESKILLITTKIHTQSNSFTLTNFATVYNNFAFLPILIAIGSVIGLKVKRGTLDFNFSLGLVILVLLVITVKLMW